MKTNQVLYAVWLFVKNLQNANPAQAERMIQQQKRYRRKLGYPFNERNHNLMRRDIYDAVDPNPFDEDAI